LNDLCSARIAGDAQISRQIIQILLDHPLAPDLLEIRNLKGRTALHQASANELGPVHELVQRGANIFAKDNDGYSPYDKADDNGVPDVVEYLLDCYCDRMVQSHGQQSLLAILNEAVYTNELSCMALPIGKLDIGAFVALKTNIIGRVPGAILACNNRQELPIHVVLRTGAPLSVINCLTQGNDTTLRAQNEESALPIHVACKVQASLDIIRSLVEQGGPGTLQARDRTGSLPLHLLCDSQNAPPLLTTVRYLVDQGGEATLQARDRKGFLPLHLLCRTSRNALPPQLDAVKYGLKTNPTSGSAKTLNGDLPLLLACKSQASEGVLYELLRSFPELIAAAATK